jgi:hypothetical protein
MAGSGESKAVYDNYSVYTEAEFLNVQISLRFLGIFLRVPRLKISITISKNKYDMSANILQFYLI